MNKKLNGAVLLLCMALGATAQDLTITIPKTDSTAYRCYPVKANTAFGLRSQIVCNANGPFSVNIDRALSFSTYGSWVGIVDDNTPINISTGQTAIFDLAVQPPPGTQDEQYTLPVNIKAYKNGSSVSGFAPAQFVVIVDNTPPTDIALSKRSASSQSVTLNFDAFDVMSKKYTDVNPDVGRKGIKQFTLALKDQDDNIVATSTSLGTEPSWHKAVGNSNVQPNTTYTAFVTATDLAGNSATSSGLSVTTAPRAPHNLVAASPGYCSVTLTWDA
ncbi:MAG: hypothetical protein RBR30_05145 [Tenuifilaceae bacterium]|nr:hypothetical protein [Tenuifilaceae bacterium]